MASLEDLRFSDVPLVDARGFRTALDEPADRSRDGRDLSPV